MAQQSTVKKRSTVAETKPEAASQPTPKQAKPFDYSKFRQSFRNEKDFYAFLAGYPNKTGILAYLYRLLPAIDMSLIGIAESSILKTALPSEMTQEFIASKFGRGKYMLRLNDANRPKGEMEVCKTWFVVDDPDLPPIYDPRTLNLGNRDNQDEISRLLQLGVLVRDSVTGAPRVSNENDGRPVAVQPQPVSNGIGSGEILSKDVFGQVLLKLITAGSQAPSDSFKQAMDIAKMMQPSQPSLSPDQIAELVTAKLERSSVKTNSEGDWFQTYERYDAFLQKVRGPAVVATPDTAAGWAVAIPQIVSQLATLVPTVMSGLQELQRMRNARPNVSYRRAAPGAETQQQEPEPQLSLPDRIAQIAALGFEKMNQGVNGWDYAAYICMHTRDGLQIYQMLEPQGVAGVMGLAAMNPQTAPFLTDPAKRDQVERFLSEFFTFNPLGNSEDELPPPAEESAAAAGASA